jgi:hypothetical protein
LEEWIRIQIWDRFRVEDLQYHLGAETSRAHRLQIDQLVDNVTVRAFPRMKNQLASTEKESEAIVQLIIHMDQTFFTVIAPVCELERLVRQEIRSRYARADSLFVLMMGGTWMTQAQIAKGIRRVDVITKGLGGIPDPPIAPTDGVNDGKGTSSDDAHGGQSRTKFKLEGTSKLRAGNRTGMVTMTHSKKTTHAAPRGLSNWKSS